MKTAFSIGTVAFWTIIIIVMVAGGISNLNATTNTITDSATSGTTTGTSSDTINTTDPQQPYKDAIYASYPGATIIKLSIEDDGRAEFKFAHNGKTYEGMMNSSYVITQIE